MVVMTDWQYIKGHHALRSYTTCSRSFLQTFVRTALACLTLIYLPLGSPTMTQRTVHLQTRKDAFGNVSSAFAFSFAVYGNSRKYHCYSER